MPIWASKSAEQLSRLNVFPSLSNRPPAFSEETVRDIVRSELQRRFDQDEKHTGSITQLFQVIGGCINRRDNYSAGQTGAMGPKARAEHVIFRQVWLQSAASLPLDKLADELSRLRTQMRATATDPDHDLSLGAVAAAQKCAVEKDGAGVLQNLAKAGHWALQCARDIGVEIAAGALGRAIGI